MKISLNVKEYLDESPGTWKDSKLSLKIVGDRGAIRRISQVIREAIAEEDV